MRSQLPEGTEITVEVAEGASSASGDPDRLQQVLVNLLDNALKYGSSPVRLRIGRSRRGVSVAVADAGPGIPRPEQKRIFEKFYRGDPQLARGPGGPASASTSRVSSCSGWAGGSTSSRGRGRRDVRDRAAAGATRRRLTS